MLSMMKCSGKSPGDPFSPGPVCFVRGTLVVMADDTLKPIEQIAIGDKVLSCDERTGQNVIQLVTHTFVSRAKTTVVVLLSSGSRIEATPEHPFYQEGRDLWPWGN